MGTAISLTKTIGYSAPNNRWAAEQGQHKSKAGSVAAARFQRQQSLDSRVDRAAIQNNVLTNDKASMLRT